jgi:signal transduction histidine kinase
VTIEVKDEGIGIPQSEQSQIFNEFFRASNAKKIEEEGTGLGLAIVKRTVEKHGGHIDFRSTEGAGAIFKIELPLAQAS